MQSLSISVSDAVREAVAHHEAGRFPQAEALYRQILQMEPDRADVRHHLGRLAVQAGEPAAGLPYLRAALEADPAQEQYWLSYAGALLATGEIEVAANTLQAAMQHGFDSQELLSMRQKADAALNGAAGGQAPAAGIEQLISLFGSGDYAGMERRAEVLLARHPASGGVWKILGVALAVQGKNALLAMRKAAELLPHDAEAHSNLGNALQSQGQFDDAVDSHRRAVSLAPDSAESHCNLGNALMARGQIAEAAASFRRALELKPELAEAHYNLGNALLGLGQFDEAAASFRRSLEIKPGYANAHYNLGNALRSLGQVDEAAASYRSALQIKPAFAEAHGGLGDMLRELGQLEAAAECYRRASEIQPGFAGLHSNLGNVLQSLGRYSEAAECYRRALSLAPDDAGTHNNLGNALQNLRQFDEALACFRRALEIRRDFAGGHNNLGNALKDLGQFDEALACFRRALEIQPDYADAHYNLGNTLKEQGKLFEAAASFRRALEIEPDFAEAHNNLGDMLRELGQFDEALACFRRALEFRPDFAEAHNNLGNVFNNQGKPNDAVEHYQKALSIRPDFAEAYNNLGFVLKEQNRPDAAVACFQQALSINPELVSAHINLSQVFFKAKRPEEAQQHSDLAYRKQCLFVLPSATAARTALMLFDAGTGNVPTKRLFPLKDNNLIVWVIAYATEDQYSNLPPYDVVFNAIGEPDLTDAAAAPLSRFMRICERPVLNSPDAVARTARHLMPELFSGVEGLLIPAVWCVEQEGAWFENPDFQFPVLVRPLGSHGGEGLTLIESRAALADVAPSRSGRAHLCNYHDYRSADGYFRKYRIIFIDRKPYPYHLGISEHWMVHYHSANMLTLPWKLEEEHRFLENPAAVLGKSGMAAIEAIGKRLDLDYAGVDFSILPDGRLLIFEANATMLAHPVHEEALQFKTPYIQKIFDAFSEMLARASGRAQTGEARP